MGFLAVFVGYSASFAIVLAGIIAMGANAEQAATGLFFSTLGMGLCGIWLPAITRVPAAVAWSLPGAAFLAASAAPPGGFPEAIGAFLLCAILIVATGIIPLLGRMIAAIPKPIANALLAGVLLKLCFAPALALGSIPLLVLPVMLAWLIGLTWNKLAAMPLAVITFLVVLYFTFDTSQPAFDETMLRLPEMSPVLPLFTFQSFISIAIPLYLVTMAGQNIPGFAVLDLNGYSVNQRHMIRNTGLGSLAIASFGAVPVNMSAVTAAMMAGEDAGRDRSKRYWSAIVCGACYTVLAFAAGIITTLVAIAPSELITAVAGLALIPALVTAFSSAFQDPHQREAPALTFLIASSGMTLLGVSGAFWGVVAGAIVWFAKAWVQKAREDEAEK